VRRALLLAALVLGAVPSCNGKETRPDIVIAVWDTCRADRLSLYGHDRPTTPWLEGFARDAVRYDRCYSPAPITAPAHASLFTGLSPHRTGLVVGKGDRVHAGLPLLAETLRDAGYETVLFTANAYLSDLTGLNRGFSKVYPVWRDLEGQARADRVLADVESWISSRGEGPPKDAPRFVFLNFMDTHQPLRPPEADVAAVRAAGDASDDLYRASLVGPNEALAHMLGTRLLDEGTLRGVRVRYDASIRHVDRCTGEILDRLGKAGLLRDAFVAVTADHGENLGEHGLMDHRLSCHDTLLHVPLVVRRAGSYEGGRVVDRMTSLMDLYPAVLEAAGVKAPEGNGVDAAPLPREGKGGGRTLLAEYARPTIFIQNAREGFPDAPVETFAPFHLAIATVRDPADRKGARKYTRWTRLAEDGSEAVAREALHDYVADPFEARDLLEGGGPAARADADRLAALLPETPR